MYRIAPLEKWMKLSPGKLLTGFLFLLPVTPGGVASAGHPVATGIAAVKPELVVSAADKARVWPLLAAGVFAERADIPAMPWKQLGTH